MAKPLSINKKNMALGHALARKHSCGDPTAAPNIKIERIEESRETTFRRLYCLRQGRREKE